LIQEIDAEKSGSRLAFLLMAGMTGIFTATNAIDDQMAEILESREGCGAIDLIE